MPRPRTPLRSAALLSVCALLALAAAQALAFYDGSDVVEMDGKALQAQVVKGGGMWLVEFYAPWCGHCQRLAPDYKKVATALKGVVGVAAVNADEHRDVAGRYQVQGFPTIKLFKNGKPVDYNGPRDVKSLKAFALGSVPNLVKVVKGDSGLDEFLSAPTASVLLFSDKKSTPELFKHLAYGFEGSLQFGALLGAQTGGGKASAGVERFGIESLPAIVVVPAGGDVPVTYDGAIDRAKIAAFLARFGAPRSAASAASGAEKKGGKKASGDKPKKASKRAAAEADAPKSDVIDVAFDAFAAELARVPTRPTLALLVPSGGAAAADEAAFVAASLKLQSLLHVVRVRDVPADASRAALGGLAPDALAATGTLVLYPAADDNAPPAVVAADVARDAARLIAFGQEHVRSTNVQTVGPEALQMVLSAGRFPKILLMTQQSETPALFRALARDFADSVDFVDVHNPPQQLLAHFHATKLPVIIGFVIAEGKTDEHGNAQAMAQPYTGPLTYKHIAEFVRALKQYVEAQQQGSASSSAGDAAVAAPVARITSQAEFDAECGGSALCVAAFLDELDERHASFVEMLERAAGALRTKPVRVVYLPSDYVDFFNALDLPFGYPNLAAISVRKQRFAPLVGPFTEAAVRALANDVLSGRAPTRTFDALPALAELDSLRVPPPADEFDADDDDVDVDAAAAAAAAAAE